MIGFYYRTIFKSVVVIVFIGVSSVDRVFADSANNVVVAPRTFSLNSVTDILKEKESGGHHHDHFESSHGQGYQYYHYPATAHTEHHNKHNVPTAVEDHGYHHHDITSDTNYHDPNSGIYRHSSASGFGAGGAAFGGAVSGSGSGSGTGIGLPPEDGIFGLLGLLGLIGLVALFPYLITLFTYIPWFVLCGNGFVASGTATPGGTYCFPPIPGRRRKRDLSFADYFESPDFYEDVTRFGRAYRYASNATVGNVLREENCLQRLVCEIAETTHGTKAGRTISWVLNKFQERIGVPQKYARLFDMFLTPARRRKGEDRLSACESFACTPAVEFYRIIFKPQKFDIQRITNFNKLANG